MITIRTTMITTTVIPEVVVQDLRRTYDHRVSPLLKFQSTVDQITEEVMSDIKTGFLGSEVIMMTPTDLKELLPMVTTGREARMSLTCISQPNTQSGYYGNRFTDSSSSSGTPSSSTPPLPSQSPSPLLPYGFPQNGSYLPYGMPSQVPTFQTSPPTSNQYLSSSQYSNTVPSSSEQEALKKKFKANSSNIVINRLSKYFNSGQIASKVSRGMFA